MAKAGAVFARPKEMPLLAQQDVLHLISATALDVLLVGYRFEVVRINAASIAAGMIDL